MRIGTPCWVLTAILVVACGGATDSENDGPNVVQSAASTATKCPQPIDGLPDPCEWLNPQEAQELLGLDAESQQTPTGDADSAGRSYVYTNPGQTTWINVAFQGLNPQVFSAEGRSEVELIELASMVYAHGLNHVYTGGTAGYPTLGFSDAMRTILIAFVGIGMARNLPEGLTDRLSMSSYYNATLLMSHAGLSSEARLKALKGLVERPVHQLSEAAR